MKSCKHCGVDLSTTYHDKGALQCKTCRNGISRYGMNRQQQIDLLESQNNKCALCEGHVELFVRNNQAGVIDHCHDTGTVRGVLCGLCNTALGQLEMVGMETFIKNVRNYMPL